MPKKKKSSSKKVNMSGKARAQEYLKNISKPKKYSFSKKKS